MFSKIDTVHIQVNDLKKAQHWYEEVLELEQIFNSGKYFVFKIGVGESTLTIQEGEVRPSSITPILFSDALEETRLKLLEKDVEVGEIEVDEDVTYFEFRDLDGNGFEVCQYIPL
ncbi:VOC family protein [Rossellomorea sp. SC111]|uniref:VOC family protein n=1 Tax=Rossellomorea sp. SC111 TaxID=2968985 RepID=UPI00215AD2B6|nr:VOC family protein [Rossellomorea sp. SC111]MCR8847197.1 VOC family protein [Rossellomorea sp. SC111]